MRTIGRPLLAVLVGAAMLCTAGCAPVTPVPESGNETLVLKGPSIVGFRPSRPIPESDEARARSVSAADLETAIGKVAKCLASENLKVRVELIDEGWVKVRDDDRDDDKEFPLYPPFEGMAGAFLLKPGRLPRFVDAVKGADVFLEELQATAAGHFGVPRCKPES